MTQSDEQTESTNAQNASSQCFFDYWLYEDDDRQKLKTRSGGKDVQDADPDPRVIAFTVTVPKDQECFGMSIAADGSLSGYPKGGTGLCEGRAPSPDGLVVWAFFANKETGAEPVEWMLGPRKPDTKLKITIKHGVEGSSCDSGASS